MIKRIFTIAVLLLVMAVQAGAEAIRVSAAISLREALTDIATRFDSKNPGETIEFNFGASGQLLTQIVNGAPVDVFVSAAEKQVKELVAAGLGDPSTRMVIAGNALVLVVPAGAESKVTSFQDLADPAIVKKLAVGEPRAVPAGQYAAQVLKHLKIDQAVADRIVHGTNVRQVLDYVRRGEVDAGLVYATDAASAPNEVRVVATAESSWHEPIEYPAILVNASKQPDVARKFIQFLGSDEAKDILRSRGFTVPAGPTTRPQE